MSDVVDGTVTDADGKMTVILPRATGHLVQAVMDVTGLNRPQAIEMACRNWLNSGMILPPTEDQEASRALIALMQASGTRASILIQKAIIYYARRAELDLQ